MSGGCPDKMLNAELDVELGDVLSISEQFDKYLGNDLATNEDLLMEQSLSMPAPACASDEQRVGDGGGMAVGAGRRSPADWPMLGHVEGERSSGHIGSNSLADAAGRSAEVGVPGSSTADPAPPGNKKSACCPTCGHLKRQALKVVRRSRKNEKKKTGEDSRGGGRRKSCNGFRS